ncbi:YbaN family protein [Bdellovibrio sp. HCB337]|uniref:YbaN family protein n=1 Tax=Bdellovibrio sp. HCB337 TaxID=3394358 RepID=UPI0039A599BE
MNLQIKRSFFVVSGFLFLVLGIIGIFLPLLPTTPFLLLTAICFSKGSEKFHSWLMNHPVLSPPIIDWQKRKAIRVQYKILATVMMLASGYAISMKDTIPMAGKASFGVFVIAMLAFIWTRNSK